jgi:1,2-diacylglycerol 3-alpha-glucosyltransferase
MRGIGLNTIIPERQRATGHGSKLRVLLISDSALPRHDGIATSLRSLTQILDSLGFSVTLIGTAAEAQHYPHVRVIKVPAAVSYCGYPVAWPMPVLVRRAVMTSDIVHVLTLGPLGIAGIVAAKISHRPIILSLHTNFDVYAEYYPPIRLIPRIAAMTTRDKRQARPIYFAASIASIFADALVIPHPGLASDITTVSHRARLYIISNEVIAHAVAVSKDKSNAADILYVGRMAAEKSVGTLLRCFAEYVLKRDRSRQLTLVGDGPMLEPLKSYASGLGLRENNVKWLGDIDNDTVLSLMSASQVLALPSLSEVDPMVLVEAAEVGLPAIVRDPRLVSIRPYADITIAPTCESFGLALLAAQRAARFYLPTHSVESRTAGQWLNLYRSIMRAGLGRHPAPDDAIKRGAEQASGGSKCQRCFSRRAGGHQGYDTSVKMPTTGSANIRR